MCPPTSSAMQPLLTSNTAPSTPTAPAHCQLEPLTDNNSFSLHTRMIQITSSPFPSSRHQTRASLQPTSKSSKRSQTAATSRNSASRTTKPARPSANFCGNNNATYNLWNQTITVSMQPSEPSKHSKITSSADCASQTQIFHFNCGITWPPRRLSHATF